MHIRMMLLLLALASPAVAGEFCAQDWELSGDALARKCTIGGSSCQTPPFPWHWKLTVDCPDKDHDMILRLKTGTPNDCFGNALRRWFCFMDYANGGRSGTDGCPQFGGPICEPWAVR